MSSLWSERQRQVWRSFLDAVQWRHQREAEVRDGFTQRTQDIEQQYQDGLAKLESDQQTALDDWARKRDETLDQLRAKYDGALNKGRAEYQGAKQAAVDEYNNARGQLEADFKEGRWTLGTVREADTKNSQDQVQQQQQEASNQIAKIEANRKKAVEHLDSWKLEIDEQSPTPNKPAHEDAWTALQGHVDTSARILEEMRTYRLPKQISGSMPAMLMTVSWLALSAIVGGVLYFLDLGLLAVVGGLVAVPAIVFPVGMMIRNSLFRKMERRAEDLWLQMEQALADAKVGRQNAIEQAKKDFSVRNKQIKEQFDTAIAELNEKTKGAQEEQRKTRDAALVVAQRKYEPYLKKVADEREVKFKQGEAYFEKQHVELRASQEQERKSFEDWHAGAVVENNERHKNEWEELITNWKANWEGLRDESQAIARDREKYFPADKSVYPEVADVPNGLPFGELSITDELVPNLYPEDERLVRPDLSEVPTPALLPFPEKASLLLETGEEGRQIGIKALEGIITRVWLGLPPGRVRCTIVDPVGRGENFAGLMHLGDKDPTLVNSRIWTEIKQIEDVLTDLTGQMETILQRFLRNQYATLAEYNEQAGEVAEPFRFLVIANFPVNFSPDAAQRVISLATSGARCGIYTFVLLDTRQSMPHGINLEDLEKACTVLTWQDGRYIWKDEQFGRYPLTLESPAAEESATRLLTTAAERAVKAMRVEVPFTYITPTFAKWWEQDSALGVDVPIGKAGARRLQNLLLGKGTSQHVLIAGKTGSGKSTLLHVLIMQLAVRYSPDMMQLYLIDFKKGVEFKTYAINDMPHVKVVAIESEREFGLSVLQRIDVELTYRGDMFRKLGVNDLPTYRRYRASQTPEEREKLPPIPRQLLIIDEFQEFFVEDDKVSQEASLLMDRIVRQGRAFGIHLMMGSQTIGGAYSLARTTIDQMAVRIALQCSEADAHLILSRENTEARLLNRPGEAIYNAQNGMLEGNNFFQIVWIDDELRDQMLKQLHQKASETNWRRRDPLIVFEGNLPADPRKNAHLLPGPRTKAPEPNIYRAYLGDAVAIKDPTCAVFRRQSGANVMMIGQAEELAFNIITTACLSVSRDHPEVNIAFCAGHALEPVQEETLAALSHVAPVKAMTVRELSDHLKVLGKEVDARIKGEGTKQPMFVMIYGIQRLRDLRKPDDDFGFGKKGEEEKPHQVFAKVIREGPPVGIFTMFWVDNLTNLQRFLDRAGMREFEMRVLFQMNANDSSNIMDSPIAARLGAQRAFFYSEDQGKMEKFRPYGLLSPTWLKEFAPTNGAAEPAAADGNGQPDGNGKESAEPARVESGKP